jgi:phage terminase large subunit
LWGALDEDGRLYIYKEHYRAQTLIKDHAAIINGFKEYKTVQIFDEEKRKEIEYNCTIADHDAQDNAELAQYDIYTKNAKKDVSIGIQKVAERLVVQRDNKPRLFVFDTCVNTIREVGKYRWQEVKDGKPVKEEPLKIDDHCCDALRYLCMEIDFGLTGGVSEISASSLGL